jgi:hypothetical protein
MKRKTGSIVDDLTQTTKTYLHHLANFLFLSGYNEIIITSIWRAISMSGHSLKLLRGKFEFDPNITFL